MVRAEGDTRGAPISAARAAALLEGVSAFLFDMDGTLIDSEAITLQVVRQLLEARGLASAGLQRRRFEGRSWRQIEADLGALYPDLAGATLAPELERGFEASFRRSFPPTVPGAMEALRAAAARGPVGIATSSVRPSLELLLDEHDLRQVVTATICAEDCAHPKPHPQPYLETAAALGVAPERCLVFEDSDPGLSSALAAGARCVAITRGAEPSPIARRAEAQIDDFRALPAGFFAGGQRR